MKLFNKYEKQIINILLKKDITLSEISAEIGISKPTTSVYLKRLEENKIIKGNYEKNHIGRTIRYSLQSFHMIFSINPDLKMAINFRADTNLDEDFVSGPYGVMEPDVGKTKETDVNEIDMVIVPGLGFDYQKNRLGRGAGFYDRFLVNLTPSIKKIGIAFECQLLGDLPIHLQTDQKVDIVVSEKAVI